MSNKEIKENKKYKFGWRTVVTTQHRATIEASSREEAQLKWKQGEFAKQENILLDAFTHAPRILEDTK